MGSSKDHFLDFRVSLPGSQKYIREYLRENEICFKIFWVIAQGPRYYRFMQKIIHQKSHATVPLSAQNRLGLQLNPLQIAHVMDTAALH